MRRQLEYTRDQELRARRVESYKSLYKLTDKMPRYWPIGRPVRNEMQEWVRALDDWYFGKAGGLFLSDQARESYDSACGAIAEVSHGPLDGTLTDAEIDRLWQAGQDLRRTLAADIGGAEALQLSGQKPSKTPPPLTRFWFPGTQET